MSEKQNDSYKLLRYYTRKVPKIIKIIIIFYYFKIKIINQLNLSTKYIWFQLSTKSIN